MTRLAAWRRAPAFAGLVALALLHVSAAVHQFEHAAEHDLSVCEACGAYNQLENTSVATTPGEEILFAPDGTVATRRAAALETPFTPTYRSRAPPLS